MEVHLGERKLAAIPQRAIRKQITIRVTGETNPICRKVTREVIEILKEGGMKKRGQSMILFLCLVQRLKNKPTTILPTK
jgi:hypothetical protein